MKSSIVFFRTCFLLIVLLYYSVTHWYIYYIRFGIQSSLTITQTRVGVYVRCIWLGFTITRVYNIYRGCCFCRCDWRCFQYKMFYICVSDKTLLLFPTICLQETYFDGPSRCLADTTKWLHPKLTYTLLLKIHLKLHSLYTNSIYIYIYYIIHINTYWIDTLKSLKNYSFRSLCIYLT